MQSRLCSKFCSRSQSSSYSLKQLWVWWAQCSLYKNISNYFFYLHKRALNTKNNTLSPIERSIGYNFKNKDYLIQAFTHKSIDKGPRNNYERLEFLGDSVLDLIISKALINEFREDEGLITEKRASLVQKSYLANMGKLLNLMDHLKINHNVNLRVEKIANKQLANIFESLPEPYILMAAYFLAKI